MRLKRTSQKTDNELSLRKRHKENTSNDYFKITLEESGLQLHESPQKCVISHEVIVISRNLKKILQQHTDYPSNVSEFYTDFQERCEDLPEFKYYLFPNIVRKTSATSESSIVSDSLVKILLTVPVLQDKLIDFIFEKTIDLATESKCGPWIQMILKCFSTLDNIVDSDKISEHLVTLLDVSSEHMVRLEIITAIPDIIGDQAHMNVAEKISRILSEDHDLIPAILDCLSYLCLSDDQYEQLQKQTLIILKTLSKCNNFANFVKFLLMPGRTNSNIYLEVVMGLRSALCWSTSIDKPEEIVSSQILTATAIRNSIISSKVIANSWLKSVSICKHNADYKPIDIIIILILYSISEEKQKQVESVVRKQIKNNILNEELLHQAFAKFNPIIKEYLNSLLSLTNSLLKIQSEPVIQNFVSHIYSLMFSELKEFCQTIVAELLQLGLDSKHCVLNILSIFNKVASKDMSILKPQSVQMLKLLERMDDMTLPEIRATMNLVCGLAYGYKNSSIKDDIQILILKELGSSNPIIKVLGILAGIHAVKYIMQSKDGEDQSLNSNNEIDLSENNLIVGDLCEAVQTIELISHSTKQFPEMIAFFYDELCKGILSTTYINKNFLHWMTDAFTNDLQQNFIENALEQNTGDLILNMQYCLNSDSEVEGIIAIDIGGVTLNAKEDINVLILSPLFQLVQTLHIRQYNGDLSQIDALLGCAIIMPVFDIDSIVDLNINTISYILDCQIHCVNWFREAVNAFSSKSSLDLKSKIFNRIKHIRELENLITQVMLKISFTYKPPTSIVSLKGSNVDSFAKKHAIKQKQHKNEKTTQDESLLPETLKSQSSHNNNITVKNKLGLLQNISFRPLNLNILTLLNGKLSRDNDENTELSIENLSFILKCINYNLENVLISRIKKKTVFSKQHSTGTYDSIKAIEYAQSVNEVLPNIIDHIKYITSDLDKSLDISEEIDEQFLISNKILEHVMCLEYIFNMLTIYFKWIGFKSDNKALLESSLCRIASVDTENSTFQPNVLLTGVKLIQKHEKYCFQLTTAVSLLDTIGALQEHSGNSTITEIMRKTAHLFLCREWKTASGAIEKGIVFNRSIDNFIKLYFTNIEISELKNIVYLLINEEGQLKGRSGTLNSFQSINKNNFHILYRNIGSALHISTEKNLNKGLTNLEHLDLWKEVVCILKHMSQLAKTLKVRNIYIAFFKMSRPIVRLFVNLGIPILEIEFKKKTEEIQDILKTLQQSTRFLQILCRHFVVRKDKALLSMVPHLKQLLEKLLYKVKAVLTANGCSEAFWMGTLTNKDINGDIIPTQQSVDSDEDSYEDCDDQELDDDNDENEILNPDKVSDSDIV